MKRPMLGGAHRGPVAPSRQRRTIRLVQLILVLMGLGLIAVAVAAVKEVSGYYPGDLASFERPRPPSWTQPLVLLILAAASLAVAAALGLGRTVKLPTPARLDEFVDRAESVAIDRARRTATESRGDAKPS